MYYNITNIIFTINTREICQICEIFKNQKYLQMLYVNVIFIENFKYQ